MTHSSTPLVSLLTRTCCCSGTPSSRQATLWRCGSDSARARTMGPRSSIHAPADNHSRVAQHL
eukprot:1854555-Amphidinium_carterae.1